MNRKSSPTVASDSPNTVDLGPAPPAPPGATPPAKSHTSRGLMLAALGVVFGDIGTSPMYAFRDCFKPEHGIALNPANVTGLLSVVFWSMMLVISVKYVAIVMKSDNRGEGGVLALSALLLAATHNWRFWTPISVLGIIGAALFFGDGFITPPITILGAMEGLTIVNPQLERLVVPGSIAVLTILFLLQKRGTGAMGKAFGPVMLVWFTVLFVLGIRWIVVAPEVLLAVNPIYAVHFFLENGIAAFLILSLVILTVTGGEALYADMGHFGRLPIRNAWFMIALPALLVNYFGQGALVLSDKDAIVNSFYMLAPDWAQIPLIGIATVAAAIASQAVISGVFSVTRAALNLGYLPRLKVLHSSKEEIGQVYVPSINWILFAGTVLLVLAYRSSSALTSAYGLAVAGAMLIDGLLVVLLLRFTRSPHHRIKIAILLAIVLLDIAFVASNSLKIPAGGWLPIVIAIVTFIVMSTWSEGRRTLSWLVAREQTPMREFLVEIKNNPPLSVPGTAVYLVSDASGVPRALSQNIRFNHVIHERNILLTFVHPEVPQVPIEERIKVEEVYPGIQRVIARYGFMETPNVVAALRAADELGVPYKSEETIYVVGHENPIITSSSGMPVWRKRLFSILMRNSQLAAVHYGAPAHRVMEVGSQVRL
ncbi:MAG: KUP/HAK/KT family potassium transporter [Candidatus Obscuribacterales bacterium]|nr:KUP/HAK/KT family potassium transporter [Steroidobacteraceae bacterium]